MTHTLRIVHALEFVISFIFNSHVKLTLWNTALCIWSPFKSVSLVYKNKKWTAKSEISVIRGGEFLTGLLWDLNERTRQAHQCCSNNDIVLKISIVPEMAYLKSRQREWRWCRVICRKRKAARKDSMKVGRQISCKPHHVSCAWLKEFPLTILPIPYKA